VTTTEPAAATPAEADWQLADTLADRIDRLGPGGTYRELATFIAEQRIEHAQALADQRARYEAVANELDRITDGITDIVGRLSLRDAAGRIRQVAQ